MQNARTDKPFKNNIQPETHNGFLIQPNKRFRAVFSFFFLMLLYFLCLRHLLFYHECVEAKPLLNSFQKTWFSLLHLFGEISWNYEETGRKFIYSLSSQINFLTPNNSLAIPISKPYIVSFINYENLKLHVHQNDTPWLISVLFWSPIFGKNFCRMTRNIRGSLFLGMDDFFCVLRNFFLQLGQSAWVSKSWPSFKKSRSGSNGLITLLSFSHFFLF